MFPNFHLLSGELTSGSGKCLEGSEDIVLPSIDMFVDAYEYLLWAITEFLAQGSKDK